MKLTLNCSYCGNTVQKEQKDFNRSKTKRFFCNRSCSSSYNNRANPKRIRMIKTCLNCSTPLPRGGRKYCDIHSPWYKYKSILTVGEICYKAKYQKHALIRNYARKIYNHHNKNKSCRNCGYSKHIEVAHIKAIESFPENTLITTINEIDNLIGLCPNCHWELDNGLLRIQDIQSFNTL